MDRKRKGTNINDIINKLDNLTVETIDKETYYDIIDNKKALLEILDPNSSMYEEIDNTYDYNIGISIHNDTSIYIEVKIGNLNIWSIDHQLGYKFYETKEYIFNNIESFIDSFLMNEQCSIYSGIDIFYDNNEDDEPDTFKTLSFGSEEDSGRIYYNYIRVTDINRRKISEDLLKGFMLNNHQD